MQITSRQLKPFKPLTENIYREVESLDKIFGCNKTILREQNKWKLGGNYIQSYNDKTLCLYHM